MRKVYKLMRQAIDSNDDVIITGETGTGKELVARAIHDNSHSSDRPFMDVNCAAMSKDLLVSELFGHEKGAFTGATSRQIGAFELAGDGTLFLDEICEMDVALQAKLLRAIQQREFRRLGGKENIQLEARIIYATNKDLRQAVKSGDLREDLYYRINGFGIHLPPLRERTGDIPMLIRHFLEQAARDGGGKPMLYGSAMNALECYSWPGNVRELEKAIRSAVTKAEGEVIYLKHLPPEIQHEFKEDVDNEKMRIVVAYKSENCVATRAAKKLGIPRSTFYHKVNKQYKIDLDAIRREMKEQG